MSIRTLFIRKMKGTLGYHFGIIRKEKHQSFNGIWCDVHEKYKQDGALPNTTAHAYSLLMPTTSLLYVSGVQA